MPKFERFGLGFQGFCFNPMYQMVPASGMRRLQFFNDGPDCEIYVDDPSIAGVANFIDVTGRSLPTGSSGIVNRFVVPGRCTVSFTVNGRSSGLTFLGFHRDARPGNPNDGVMISVKGSRAKSVTPISLSDTAGHSGKLTLAEISDRVNKVKKYYLDQCNLEIKPTVPKVVQVQKALSDPIVWDKTKGGVGDILDILMAVRGDVISSDIVVLFMWDVASTTDVGVDTLAYCLSDIFRPGSQTILYDDSHDAYVLAHEFGHAFGLKHNFRTGTLMNAFSTSLSSELEQYEIDTVNDDGIDKS